MASLKRRLWAMFARYVCDRDYWICYTCGRKGDQAGHFYSRRLASIWIDPKNVHCQCATCNLYLHGNPGAYAEAILRDYGPEELARLTYRANHVTKQWRRPELERLIIALRDGGGAAYELAYYGDNL